MDKKKLRVVFLSEFVGTVDRGVETYVLEISKRIKRHYQLDILTGQDSYSFKKIYSGDYDIIIPTNGRLQSLIALIVKILKKNRVIISGQSGIGKDDIWNITFTIPDVYVALTDSELNWAKKWVWKTSLIKIPNGVDLNKFSPIGQKARYKLEGKVVLSVGALRWYKYHERTIRAVALTSDISLLIAGDGPEKDKLLSLGNTLLGAKRFKIIQVDHNQIPELYRAADLFVLPSWEREAFGIVYVEAMASNLPIVAPDDLARREIIGNAGLFVNVKNTEKYAAAINEALQKDWKNVPRKQSEKFSWDKIALMYKDLIDSLTK